MAVFGARRAQKPDALRRLHGSRHRPHHHAQPRVLTEQAPVPPAWLSDRERAAWDRLAEILTAQRRYTADAGPWLMVAATAAADADAWHAEAAQHPRIVETSDGYKAHPAHQQARLARRAWIDVLREGGLTPASVGRVVMPPPVSTELDPFDELDRLLRPGPAS